MNKNPLVSAGGVGLILGPEDSTCQGATQPTGHNNRASALQPVLRNKRSHHSKKPMHRKEGWRQPAATRKLVSSNQDPAQPKITT